MNDNHLTLQITDFALGPTSITLRGYSYISYRIYDWKDRAHSESNRISLIFRVIIF